MALSNEAAVATGTTIVATATSDIDLSAGRFGVEFGPDGVLGPSLNIVGQVASQSITLTALNGIANGSWSLRFYYNLTEPDPVSSRVYGATVVVHVGATIKRTFGPLLLTSTVTTSVYNNTSALIYDVIKQISVANITGGAVTFTLYIGASATDTTNGKQLFQGVNVPANKTLAYSFAGLKLTSAEWIVGSASALNSLTIMALGEQYVV